MSDEPQDDLLQRLDPDRAADGGSETRPADREHRASALAFSPRRYQWIAGLIALVVVVVFSIVQLTSHRPGTAGVPTGQTFAAFAVPLATSTLVGDANLHPPCTQAGHDSRALNVCLLMRRGPLVLDFFVTGSGECVRTVDAMQAIAGRFRSTGVQFAAVAVRAGPGATRRLVRRHGWTIPVAYDRDGGAAESHGIVVCPLIELVRRGGVVARRLIGGHWDASNALAAQVAVLAHP